MPEENLDAKLDEVNRKIAETTQQIANSQNDLDSWWSTSNAMTMSSAILGFGVFVILIAAFLIRSGKSAESILRVFGTIAGYLLGKESKD